MTGTGPDWRPGVSAQRLRQRALSLATARQFFIARGMVEIETPTIIACPVSDPQLANIPCRLASQPGTDFFLHTSPEYHMKRALAAGSGDIFQISKVFRDGEQGPRHLPEFTLAEWYRCGVGYQDFIAETVDFVRSIGKSLGTELPPVQQLAYSEVCRAYADVDPLTAPTHELAAAARRLLGAETTSALEVSLGADRDAWLDLLVVSAVEPGLADAGFVVVDRYPASQAALARLDANDPRVAERFEIYLHGLELANGYHELSDAGEQARRFAADLQRRTSLGRPTVPIDEELLAALAAGLPDCCGVALGLDRLLMACLGETDIRRVVAFTAA